jgi:hypothetical protein
MRWSMFKRKKPEPKPAQEPPKPVEPTKPVEWSKHKQDTLEDLKASKEAFDALHRKPLEEWLCPEMPGLNFDVYTYSRQNGRREVVEVLLRDPVKAMKLIKPFADLHGWGIEEKNG